MCSVFHVETLVSLTLPLTMKVSPKRAVTGPQTVTVAVRSQMPRAHAPLAPTKRGKIV